MGEIEEGMRTDVRGEGVDRVCIDGVSQISDDAVIDEGKGVGQCNWCRCGQYILMERVRVRCVLIERVWCVC